MASVIALDLGNENCVIAIPRHGGVDIALNQAAQRLTPTMVALDNDRRYAGDAAKTQQMQNVVGTVTNLKRLIGLRYDDPETTTVQQLVSVPLVELPDGCIGIKMMYDNKETVLRIEQCLAILLSDMFKIARDHNTYTNDCVVVVSPWWGERQRRAILDAAAICGFKVLKLLNSTTAAAITYSMYNRSRLPSEPNKTAPIVLIDFGDSSMNVAVAQLRQGSVEICGFCSDPHLGGSYFTTALTEVLLKKVKDKYHIDPTKNPRAMLRFRAAVEKTKKVLSANTLTRFEVPCLMNDIDVLVEIKREEFEAQIEPLVDRIEAPVTKALELAQVKKEQLFAIEVLGGASRVALVKSKIAKIFGREPTQSLNPDEAFAMGGGFQAAIICPQYSVDLNVKDVSPSAVNAEYAEPGGEKKVLKLFKQFNVVPTTVHVPIKVVRKSTVRIFGDEGDIGTVDIDTATDDPLTVKLKVRLTPDSLVDVQSAFHEVTEETEEKPEKEGDAPKKKTIKKEIQVKYEYQPAAGLSNAMITELQSIEKTMSKKDELEEKIDISRNELEGYIFRMQSALSRDYPEYFDPAKKEEFLQKVSDVQAWFSDKEFDRLPVGEYESRLSTLKAFGEPAMKRRDLRAQIPSIVDGFKKRAYEVRNSLDSKDEKFNHITQEEREPLRNELRQYDDWLDKKKAEVEAQPKHQDPNFKSSDAEERICDIDSKVRKLLCKPKPAPPKPKVEPKKEEAKPAEAANGKEGQSAEAKPAEAAKTEEAKPAAEAAKPEEAKPAEAAKPEEAKPSEAAKPEEAKPADAKPEAPKPEEAKK